MYILVIVLSLIACGFSFVGWRALIFEDFKFFSKKNNWKRESGIFGLTGSIIMFLAGYILVHQPDVWLRFGDSRGLGWIMGFVSIITFGMCGLAWFSKTKLAFLIDNRRWPTEEEMDQWD